MKQKAKHWATSIVGFRVSTLVVLIAILVPGAVAQNGQLAKSEMPSDLTIPVRNPEGASERVRIGPGDLLAISVFDIPELGQEVRVSDRGDGVLTLIGALHLAGLSPSEAQTLVERRLRDGDYIRDPHVSIVIREYETQGVSVLGEVQKPGVYAILGKRNLLDIISEAGGITQSAGLRATIKRRADDSVFEASLSNQPSELIASNLELQPGDTVIVPKAGIVYVLGDVGRPGGFLMRNNGQMTLLQAVAFAAGASQTASQSKTRVIHQNPLGFKDSTVDLKHILEGKEADLTLSAGDIVYVPSNNVKKLLFEHSPITSLAQSAASAAVYIGMVP